MQRHIGPSSRALAGLAPMRACIHRGATQIGGSCVELDYAGQRLILDVGLPLEQRVGVGLDPLVGKLASGAPIAGVVLSHNHPDHSGLADSLDSAVDVWGPAVAQRMQQAGSRFIRTECGGRAWRPLKHGRTERIGPFAVTALAVDHSAYESYALLVEAGGRRLFYTGDLRAHGRKPGMWRRLVESPPPDIDVMLMEGTTLSRPVADGLTEQGVETRLVDVCDEADGMVLALYSAHNVDRLVSVYRAARRSGRTLVLDLYGAAVAAATGRATIPQPGWDGIRVFVPHHQRREVIRRGTFADITGISRCRVYPEELRESSSAFVMTMRGSMTGDLDRAACVHGAHAVWGMWPGYLRRPGGERTRAWLGEREIPLTVAHASGHARPVHLGALAAAVAPGRLVPIHTEAPDRFRELYDRVEPHPDGEWWTV